MASLLSVSYLHKALFTPGALLSPTQLFALRRRELHHNVMTQGLTTGRFLRCRCKQLRWWLQRTRCVQTLTLPLMSTAFTLKLSWSQSLHPLQGPQHVMGTWGRITCVVKAIVWLCGFKHPSPHFTAGLHSLVFRSVCRPEINAENIKILY